MTLTEEEEPDIIPLIRISVKAKTFESFAPLNLDSEEGLLARIGDISVCI